MKKKKREIISYVNKKSFSQERKYYLRNGFMYLQLFGSDDYTFKDHYNNTTLDYIKERRIKDNKTIYHTIVYNNKGNIEKIISSDKITREAKDNESVCYSYFYYDEQNRIKLTGIVNTTKNVKPIFDRLIEYLPDKIIDKYLDEIKSPFFDMTHMTDNLILDHNSCKRLDTYSLDWKLLECKTINDDSNYIDTYIYNDNRLESLKEEENNNITSYTMKYKDNEYYMINDETNEIKCRRVLNENGDIVAEYDKDDNLVYTVDYEYYNY